MEEIKKACWDAGAVLFPLPVVLIGCGGQKGWKDNLLTIAWTGIVCSNPAMLSLSVRPERYSYKMIKETGEFSVNIPSVQLASKVDWCGVKSGRDFDKFKECKFSLFRGNFTRAPMVAEAPVNLECVVEREIGLGSHHLFLGTIKQVHVSEALLDIKGKFDFPHADILGYAHGNYCSLGPVVDAFGFSVKKKS